MAENLCPNCNKEYWTSWFDEEIEPPWGTVNSCRYCGYFAYEDDTRAEDCPQCKLEKMLSYHKDYEKEFQYCCRCTYKKIVKLDKPTQFG